MVSNASSLGDDLSQIGSTISGAATDVGQAMGIVEDDLIPGDPAATSGIASNLTKLGGAFDRAGQGFKKIDTGGWHGQAADAARGYLDTAPPKWFKASDSFNDAGTAVADYQRVLAESQKKTASAKADLERAEKASQAAADKYNAGPRTSPFTDPHAEQVRDAEAQIRAAKAAVQEAGDRAAQAVRAAGQGAPAEPGALTQIKENLIDAAQGVGRTLGSVGTGAVGAVVDLGKLGRMVAPLDPYKFTHPAQSQEAAGTLAMGVVGAVQNPYGAVKTTVDVDGWKNDPAKTLGGCIPDALASLAGGAGAASRLGRGLRKITEKTDELSGAGRHTDDLGRTETPPPSPPAGHHGGPPTQHTAPQPHATPETHQTPTNTTPSHPAPDYGHQPHPEPDYSGYQPREDGGFGPRGSDPLPEATPEPRYQNASPRHRPDDWDDHDGMPNGHANSDRIEPPSPRADPTPDPGPDPAARGDETPTAGRPEDTPEAAERAEERPDQQADQHHQEQHPAGREPDPALSEEDRQTYRERIDARPGVSFEEGVAKLREEHPELGHLDDEKAMSVRRYVGEDANSLNRVLRDGDAIDRDYMRPEANVLRSALDEIPRVDTVKTPEAFRDIGVSDKDFEGILERYQPGTTVEESGFTSASKDIPPAFFSEHGADKPNKVRFIIEEPQHARDLEATNPDEREMLWADHNRFGVQKVEKVGDRMHIHMRDLGQGS